MWIRTPFWRIQLGVIDPGKTASLKELVKLYYMCHAEFELGGRDASLGRIVSHIGMYGYMPTDLYSQDGKRLYVFTKDITVPEEINNFVKRPHDVMFDLRAPSFLEAISQYPAGHEMVPTFWWCIDNGFAQDTVYKGDWMAVFGEDIDDLMTTLLNEQKKWDNLSKEAQDAILNKW